MRQGFNEIYRKSYQSVLSFITDSLSQKWASNPELASDFIKSRGDIENEIPIEFVVIPGGPYSSKEISNQWKSLADAYGKVLVFELDYPAKRVYEGWYLCPGFGRGAITTIHLETDSIESLMRKELFRTRIVETLVYLAREEYSTGLALKNNLNALNHPDIVVGSKIKNISIGRNRFSTVEIVSIEEPNNDGLVTCTINGKKRGTRNSWQGTLDPSALVIAIHNRNRIAENPRRVTIDLCSDHKIGADGAIASQNVLV
jgi:hypothetical protein